MRPYFKFELYNVFNNDALITWDTTVNPVYDAPVDELGLPITYEKGPRFGEGRLVKILERPVGQQFAPYGLAGCYVSPSGSRLSILTSRDDVQFWRG